MLPFLINPPVDSVLIKVKMGLVAIREVVSEWVALIMGGPQI